MIRINLLPGQVSRRASVGINLGAIALGLILIEVVGLLIWYQVASAEVEDAQKAARQTAARVKDLEEAKKRLKAREQAKETLTTQNAVFEALKASTVGPASVMQFLSYALTRKEENLYNRDEIAAQEKAGWVPTWDADNLWLTELSQDDTTLIIRGRARDHEDVTEFQRRVESSLYFYCVSLVFQEKVFDEDFKDLEVAAFEIEAELNYGLETKLMVRRDEMSDCLRAMYDSQVGARQAAAKRKGGSKAKAKAEKGGG